MDRVYTDHGITNNKILLIGFAVVVTCILSFVITAGMYYKIINTLYGKLDENIICADLFLLIHLFFTFSFFFILCKKINCSIEKHEREKVALFESVTTFCENRNRIWQIIVKMFLAVLLFILIYFRNGFFESWMFIQSYSVEKMILVCLKNYFAQCGALLFFTIICNSKLNDSVNSTGKSGRILWFFVGLIPMFVMFPFYSLDPYYAPLLLFVYYLFSKRFFYFENSLVHGFAIVVLPVIATIILNTKGVQ